MKNKTHFSDNETKAFKGENLHVQSKSLIRELIQKPFLKWVGGKTQIIDNIVAKIPQKITIRKLLTLK